MGERGVVQFNADGGTVYLYTHWQGHRLRELVQEGMKEVARAQRTGDAAYATRIIMQHCWDGEGQYTGWRVSATEPHTDYPIVVIDWDLGLIYEKGYHKDPIFGNTTRTNVVLNVLSRYSQEGVNESLSEWGANTKPEGWVEV